MNKSETLWARWLTFMALFFMFWVYLFSDVSWTPWVSGLAAGFLAAFLTSALELWLRLFQRWSPDEKKHFDSNNQTGQASTYTQITFNSLRKLLQIHTEKEILETVMQAGIELMRVSGASFVPYDEWGQSLPTMMQGKVPGPALQSWAQRLSLPETRQECKNCETLQATSDCMLLAIIQLASAWIPLILTPVTLFKIT